MQSLSFSTALTLYQTSLQLVQSPTSLVIVDSAVKDFEIVVHGLNAAAELLVLDANRDGIEQISSKLKACSGVENIHIVAPSCPGIMKLGKTCLDAAALEGYRMQIAAWRQALSPQAHVWLYGHNLAIGIEGMALVGRLSQLTGAVVAPSSLPIHAGRKSTSRKFVPLAG